MSGHSDGKVEVKIDTLTRDQQSTESIHLEQRQQSRLRIIVTRTKSAVIFLCEDNFYLA